ncbi:hypothetical protein BIY23_04335 [Wolbachia pipientis]|uniref:S-adenosylmethionine uptake transporter n=1 Tax=Wolbachia pipientis TaxID=955 RepID=A0A1E7QJM3_WOLPI|nr:DMT family transporter [Wolbachia pipientis]OEY86424.1 hypothetical protein BIY23_04335 [Wolbachia pipientis]
MVYKIKTYLKGVVWFILSLLSSAANDIIVRYLGLHLQSFQIVFFRFLFGIVAMLPLIMYYGIETLKTNSIFTQIIRGILLFLGMVLWSYGLTMAQVTTATVVSFTMPLFILLLAALFLSENIIWQRWIVTIVGFVSIVVTLKPNSDIAVFIFIIAILFFAMLDIINKRLVIQESIISMLFFSSLVVTILSGPFVLIYWYTPSWLELILLFILGINANLILFFILKAFAIVDVTALAPYRYFELVISTVAAYFMFNELPDKNILYSTLILIPSTLFIIYSENKKF